MRLTRVDLPTFGRPDHRQDGTGPDGSWSVFLLGRRVLQGSRALGHGRSPPGPRAAARAVGARSGSGPRPGRRACARAGPVQSRRPASWSAAREGGGAVRRAVHHVDAPASRRQPLVPAPGARVPRIVRGTTGEPETRARYAAPRWKRPRSPAPRVPSSKTPTTWPSASTRKAASSPRRVGVEAVQPDLPETAGARRGGRRTSPAWSGCARVAVRTAQQLVLRPRRCGSRRR